MAASACAKRPHPDDADSAVRGLSGVAFVVAGRYHERVGPGIDCADRLLLHAADPVHAASEVEFTRYCHLVAVQQLAVAEAS